MPNETPEVTDKLKPDKFAAFFERKLPAKPEQKPPNNWDEEGIFDLDSEEVNEATFSAPNTFEEPQTISSAPQLEGAPPVVSPLSPEIVPPSDELSDFFGPAQPPALRPGENHRRDLVYVAQAYVSSFKEGNPLSLKLLAQMCGKTEKEVTKAFSEKEWLHFFNMFGVDPPSGNYVPHLTPRQLQTLQIITNPLDSRKLNVILREVGVSPSEWRMWMRQPEFKDLYNKWMKDGMKDVQGEVARQVTARATQGDARAIETYLKLNGVNLQAANSDLLVPFLLRELQKYMNQEQLATFVGRLKELTSGSN